MILATNSPVRPTAHSLSKPLCLLRFPCQNLGFGPRPDRGIRGLLLAQSSEMGFIRKLSICCLTGRSKKGQKVEVDSVYGGQDIFDPAPEVHPDHLVIMVNGIIGSSEDWKYAAKQFAKKLSDKVIVHRSECNSLRLTFDGVDRMGERLSEEVLDVVTRWPEVHKISFVAHSLGGLVARYAIGRLYQHYEAKVAGLEPMNFITVATPHLGSRGNKQLPFLCGLPFLEKQASQTAHLIAGRSGNHLFLTDKDDDRPLLLRMVYDFDDLKFMSGLRSFKRRVAYANANYDHVVGWRTSSIRRQHELPKSNLLVKDEKYPHIVHVEVETTKDTQSEASSFASSQTNDLEARNKILFHIHQLLTRFFLPDIVTKHKWKNRASPPSSSFSEEMIRGLTQVPWERVDVSFRKSRQRYVAHNTIQVKSYWLNSDGADVVLHIIDNFLP